MRRQIFRQMKQKAKWILDVFTSIFVKYESLFRIWRMQIASSDFLRDEGENGENPLWIFEYFPEISRKICTQDACEKIRNRLWREIWDVYKRQVLTTVPLPRPSRSHIQMTGTITTGAIWSWPRAKTPLHSAAAGAIACTTTWLWHRHRNRNMKRQRQHR